MDRVLADTYLTDWAIWSNSDIRQGLCSQQPWQREMESGYAEEIAVSRKSISTNEELLQITDGTVARVSAQYPAMGKTLKRFYLKNDHTVDKDMLNTALLRFIGAWGGHVD